MDVRAMMVPPMMVMLMRVAALNMGKDGALRDALLPKVAEFRRTGNFTLFINTADEVLGLAWPDVGFEHITPSPYDKVIREVIDEVRRERTS